MKARHHDAENEREKQKGFHSEGRHQDQKRGANAINEATALARSACSLIEGSRPRSSSVVTIGPADGSKGKAPRYGRSSAVAVARWATGSACVQQTTECRTKHSSSDSPPVVYHQAMDESKREREAIIKRAFSPNCRWHRQSAFHPSTAFDTKGREFNAPRNSTP